MKQFYIYLMLLIGFTFLNGCSKDDESQQESDTTEVTLPKEAYRLQIVEAKFSQELPEEEYDGTLGNTPIKFVRADEHTLFFYIPGEITVGEIDLKIPQLNVSNRLNVKNPVLTGAAETVLQPVFKKTTPEYQQISTPEYADYLTTVNATLKDYYQTLTAEEKNDMALFYQINEKLFSEILDANAQKGDPVKDVYALVRRHQKAVAAMFLGGVLVATGAPVIGSAVVIAGVVKILQDDGVLVAGINVVMNYVRENGVIDKPAFNKTFNAGDIVFVDDELKAINLYAKQRKMISSDRNSGAIGLVTFFEAHDMLYDIARKINEEITRRKDNWFFSKIPLIPVRELPNTATTTTTTALTEEAFGYMNFSVADNNVKITEAKFENGIIRMKMTIVNPVTVTGNNIKTQLNYTYKEEFSNVSGSFPVEIHLDKNPLIGNWILIEREGIIAGEMIEDGYYDDCTYHPSNMYKYIGNATFTDNSFNIHSDYIQSAYDLFIRNPDGTLFIDQNGNRVCSGSQVKLWEVTQTSNYIGNYSVSPGIITGVISNINDKHCSNNPSTVQIKLINENTISVTIPNNCFSSLVYERQ